MHTASYTPPVPKKYAEWTKLRYRILFALVMFPAIYYCLPIVIHGMNRVIFVDQSDLQRVVLAIVAVWTVWSSIYKYASWKDAFTAHTLVFTLFSWTSASWMVLAPWMLSYAVGLSPVEDVWSNRATIEHAR